MSDQSQSSDLRLLFESALQDYQNQTGTPLPNHPFAEKLQNCDGKIIKSINRVVYILQIFSDSIFGDAVGLSFPPAKAVFTGFSILLTAVKDVGSSYGALVDLFESMERFVNRLNIYTRVPLTRATTEIVVKIMMELLSTLALVTKQIRQKRPMKFVKKLLGENHVEAVLERLDRLTLDEARTTAAQSLEVVYGLVQNMRVAMDDGNVSIDNVRIALELIQEIASDMNKSKRENLLQSVRNWLSPPDPWKNHNIALKLRYAGTATWFVQGQLFSEWKSSGPNSLLWIHGKPGAGKSILCSSIIEDINRMRRSGLASVVFFYCDFREDQKKELRGLLSSLLVQLCHQSDPYCSILSNLYSTHENGSQNPSDDALIECLKEILKVPGQAPVYFFLDALDECPVASALPSPRDTVLILLEELVDSRVPNLRICVTSRPEADITAVLDRLQFHSISLHDEAGQMKDIEDYIKAIVQTDRMMGRWKAADQQRVVDVLTKKAHGMFRWVYCQVVYLRRCHPSRIRYILDELPETLDETYERILQDICEANWEPAHRLLQCVAVASRPFRVEELSEFLAFDFTAGTIPKYREDWLIDDPIYTVLSTTSSLLVVVNVNGSQVIQISHFSVKEFLTAAPLTATVVARRYHISITDAHTLAAQACLGMLLHLDKDITRHELERFPLVEYATKHWVDHAQFEDVSRRVEDGMKPLFDPTKPHLEIWVWIYDIEDLRWHRHKRGRRPSQPRGSALYYAALCGFEEIVKFLVIEHSQDVDSRDFEHKWTPLHAASRKGHCEVARFLLDCGADMAAKDKDGSTPLHVASRWGHAKVVCLLLDRGADANAEDNQDNTPSFIALVWGHVNVTHIFLERAVGVIPDGQSPLHRASLEGNVEDIRILLEGGADVTTQDDHGWSPLHVASFWGHVAVARILLERGANATAQADNGLTALHIAALEGHVEVTRILLECGADVTAKEMDGLTPLHIASGDGQVEIARLLLEHGAHVTAQDRDGRTPLDIASQMGQVEAAHLLQ